MKSTTKFLAGALCLSLALSLCTGCGKKAPASSSLPPSSVTAVSSDPLSSGMVTPESGDTDSGITASFIIGESSLPADSSMQSGTAVSGGDSANVAAFQDIFAKNPIDQAMTEALDSAEDARTMVKAASGFADIWETEAGIAHKKAQKALTGSALEAYRKSQSTWTAGKDAALSKIQTEAREEGGSDAALELATRTAEFYRSRVYDIYLTIYLATGQTPALTYNGEAD